jgi:hypothetical protein
MTQEYAANGAIGGREAFERELVKRIPGAQLQLRDADDEFRPGEYEHATHEFAWRMWQARAALTAEKVAAEPISDDHAATLWRLARMTDAAAWTAEFRKAVAPQQPAQSAEQDDN